MKRPLSRLAVLLAVSLFSALATFASEVVLKNGDRLSGRIVGESAEAIVLETDYAGTLTIARTHIEKIGEQTAAAPKPAVEAKPAAAAPLQEAKVAAFRAPRRLFGGGVAGLVEGWEGNANVGFSYTSGNSNNTTMTTGMRASKSGMRDKLTVYARSLWNSNRGTDRTVTTQNAFWGGARYDRNLDGRQFGYVSYDFERDRPNKLNLRSVAGAGLGRHVFKTEAGEMDLLLGGAWNRTWQTGANTDTPEAVVGVNAKHRLNGRLKFQNSMTFYQNVTDRSEYRFIVDTTLSADVTKRVGVYISFGDRFNNDPLSSSKRNDFLVTTGMKWNFGRKE